VLLTQEAWDKAEALSAASGHPYDDRWGVRQNVHAENLGITISVMREYCRRHALNMESGDF